MQASLHIATLINLLCENYCFVIVLADVCSISVNIAIGRAVRAAYILPVRRNCELRHIDFGCLP